MPHIFIHLILFHICFQLLIYMCIYCLYVSHRAAAPTTNCLFYSASSEIIIIKINETISQARSQSTPENFFYINKMQSIACKPINHKYSFFFFVIYILLKSAENLRQFRAQVRTEKNAAASA